MVEVSTLSSEPSPSSSTPQNEVYLLTLTAYLDLLACGVGDRASGQTLVPPLSEEGKQK